ncbi:MAG: UDP-N-acetylmuramoyl-tripeptide--D-alanyl-D-alanine ligase [Magnetococcales bacterium]|nr:UDP-N-acetylmuramoyl-tripeptide--D-alanyl-D-alanine ligase [Magnetococcales bacterium]
MFDLEFASKALGVTPILPAAFSAPAPFATVTIDSRQVVPGSLFVAIPGPRFDGHDFIAEAAAKGCAAAIVSRPPEGPPPLPLLLVPDTQAALTRLAIAWRERVRPMVVAVTGSSGKTTVKEMIAACLAARGGVHATRGNLNNHLGLPLTLLAMPADCRVLVAEMGMSAAGEIRHLASIAPPDVAVVTSITAAHLEHLGSLENIARAKAELLEALAPSGLGIIPGDAPFGDLLRAACRGCVRTFGLAATDPARAIDPRFEAGGQRFFLRLDPEGVTMEMRVRHPGRFMVANAVAAAAAAHAAGADPATIAAAIAAFQPAAGRGGIRQSRHGFSVVDDTYNANPGSMAVALESLSHLAPPGRRVAVLGDMLELGPTTRIIHAELATAVRQAQIDRLFTAGPCMAALHQAVAGDADRSALHADDPAAWLGKIRSRIGAGDVVLVKGSRGMRMERIVQDLLAD